MDMGRNLSHDYRDINKRDKQDLVRLTSVWYNSVITIGTDECIEKALRETIDIKIEKNRIHHFLGDVQMNLLWFISEHMQADVY